MSIDTSNSVQPTVVYSNDTTTKTNVTKSTDDTQSSFLQLLVAQITNQTPDNTLDATEMISQFSQMNSALQLEKLSKTLNTQKLATATTLINQNVTLQFENSNGRTATTSGVVTGVDYTDVSGEPKIIVDGTSYSLDSVRKVGA